MFIKKRARKVLAEVVPLLRELYPDKTDEQRAGILTVFSAAHPGQPIADLDRSHIDVLIQTLRYWVSGHRFKEVEGATPQDRDAALWPGIEDACDGCCDFKAKMLELQTGIKVKTDQEGHVLSPITVDDFDPSGQALSDEFKDWIVHGVSFPRADGESRL